MVRVLRSGGPHFSAARDLLRPADEPTLQHLVNQYAGGANDHQRSMFRGFAARGPSRCEKFGALVAASGWNPDGVQANVGSTLDVVGRKSRAKIPPMISFPSKSAGRYTVFRP